MKYFFHPEAEAEFIQAVEVYSTIERIAAYPKAWTILTDDIRRCLTRRFPYGVYM